METIRLPDMKALATFKAVVERGGVAEAARFMCVGQPAVTKRLRGLDACYGSTLMERKGRRLSLTSVGQRVYQFSRLVLDHHDLLLDDLNTLRDGERRLRLETTFAIGEHLLPDLLLSFAETHPEYEVVSRMGYTRRIQTHLATGLADMALLKQPPDHPDILVQKWRDDELLLICGPKHPFSETDMIPINQLQKLKFVLREARSSLRLTLDQELRNVGITQLKIAMEVGSTDTIIEMLERGKHVSFLPRFAVLESIKSGTLHHIKTEGLRIKSTLWIARTRTNIDHPVAEAFIKLLRATSTPPV